jgi:hypothetical protein
VANRVRQIGQMVPDVASCCELLFRGHSIDAG